MKLACAVVACILAGCEQPKTEWYFAGRPPAGAAREVLIPKREKSVKSVQVELDVLIQISWKCPKCSRSNIVKDKDNRWVSELNDVPATLVCLRCGEQVRAMAPPNTKEWIRQRIDQIPPMPAPKPAESDY